MPEVTVPIVDGLRLADSIPVIANADFGHTDPMATIPIGGTVRLAAHADTTTIEVHW